MTVADIYSLAEEGLKEIEEEIACSSCSGLSYINNIADSIFKSGGKRIRSLLLLLAAGLSGYTGRRTKALGAIIEQVHTASLMHDDVVDNAATRRGVPSSNTLYGNRVSVLTGDCLYTSAFLKLLKKYPTPIVSLIVTTVNQMSEAEVLQLQKTSDLNITGQEYMQIVFGKTAALFSATCASGSLLANPADMRRKNLLYSFGTNVGCAFQLQDDLMDYLGNAKVLGKQPGTDMTEKKVTLPLILLLENSLKYPKDYNAIKKLFLSGGDKSEKLGRLLLWLEKYGIRPKAEAIVNSYIKKAQKILLRFESSAYRDALTYLTGSLKQSQTVGRELSEIVKNQLIKQSL
ncbi:MAG: polyprenyl synthetase family protein [Deferribacteraceae bacterium]|jgi:octaprenyl-diphosphate synthase|nr:polyprenyl synthetase family protein [Deferribacteraceae bacterium]